VRLTLWRYSEITESRFVISALQLVLAIAALGAVIWIGDALAGGIEAALGEKPMRDRDA
jgi:hypothetical protein